MGLYKTFFSANTTLQEGAPLNNTGQNEVVEFWYGGAASSATTSYNRFIFRFDTTKLREKYSSGEIMSGSVTSHKLSMTSTGSFDKRLLGQTDIIGRQRASSFDMILSLIPTGQTNWVEGVGNSFNYGSRNTDFGLTEKLTDGPSSWKKRTTLDNWEFEGVYSGNAPTETILTQQNFELGNENLSMDITETMEKIISGETANSGLILSLSGSYETLTSTTRNFFGFFSRHTNTIYSPSIITSFSGSVQDDRKRVYVDKTNRLYLYTQKNRDPINLDSVPSEVTIRDYDDTIFSAITGSSIVQQGKGIYYVDLFIPNSGGSMNDHTFEMWTDTWSGVTVDTIPLPAVELEFTIKDNKNYFNIGNNLEEPVQYGFSFYGISNGEKIKQGDVRKVFVIAQVKYNPEDDVIVDNLQYRLYIRQGRNQIDIIPFTDVNRGFNQNYLTIDTSFLFQHEYFLQLKLTSNDVEITLPEPLSFQVVEEL
ncbi:hypothetical protein COB55_05980 [Candidatus Wolfebacteria bacterium]|nr:MAG: hypothetical protein COB55_05980 [Candidatus Wolfebacteria bacterium]